MSAGRGNTTIFVRPESVHRAIYEIAEVLTLQGVTLHFEQRGGNKVYSFQVERALTELKTTRVVRQVESKVICLELDPLNAQKALQRFQDTFTADVRTALNLALSRFQHKLQLVTLATSTSHAG